MIVEPFVLLETDKPDQHRVRSMWFTDPVEVISLRTGDDLAGFFERIDRAVASGFYIAGYFSYELGLLFEDRLRPLMPSMADRLAWVGVFNAPSSAHSHQDTAVAAEPVIGDLRLNTTKSEYIAAVHRIKAYIEEGDTYQVNFTAKLRFSFSGTPEALYAALKRRQRVAYAALLYDGERSVISLSPELFVRKDGLRLESKPMKGTVHRGRWTDEDDALAVWLHNDPKNRAENAMIVDLIRNDLGRLARSGGVSVDDVFDVEAFDTLFQMTSTVRAELDHAPLRRSGWLEFFRALFPCGSITGAPKIRTMQIIAELEKEPRGIYSGAIGYIAPDGSSCFSVAIRTLVTNGANEAEMGVGSGITYDSDPASEYQECLLKARFLTTVPPRFSLIETLLLEKGMPALVDGHLRRLADSARYFGRPCDVEAVRDAITDRAQAHPTGRYKIRLLLHADGAFDLTCKPIGRPPASITFRIHPERIDETDRFFYHKTTHRPLYLSAEKQAVTHGIDDLIFLNSRGELTESTRFNLFLQMDGQLLTPALDSGLLPGALRQQLLDIGECEEAVLREIDLERAEAIFLGNSVRGLIPARLRP